MPRVLAFVVLAFGLVARRPSEPNRAEFYQKVCDAGDAQTCNNLGWMYEHGEGVAQDKAKAVARYQKAYDGRVAMGCEAREELRRKAR